MLSLQQTMTFAAAAAIIIAIPGSSVVCAISRALAHGRRTAMAIVVGNAVGPLLLVVLVAVGSADRAGDVWPIVTELWTRFTG